MKIPIQNWNLKSFESFEKIMEILKTLKIRRAFVPEACSSRHLRRTSDQRPTANHQQPTTNHNNRRHSTNDQERHRRPTIYSDIGHHTYKLSARARAPLGGPIQQSSSVEPRDCWAPVFSQQRRAMASKSLGRSIKRPTVSQSLGTTHL